MTNIFDQLKRWSITAEHIRLTPAMLEKLTDHAPAALVNDASIDVYTFTYDVSGRKISGFLVAPKKMARRLPAIIFNRGGTGDYGLIPKGRLFTRIADMAKRGYLVVGSQYPGNALSEGSDERGGESDVRSVLRLKELIGSLDDADEDRIGMFGESRGGMMTYLSLKHVSWIKAAVTVGGLANLERSLRLRPEMKGLFEDCFGNTAQGIIDRSAVKWADELHETPLCIIHGGNDDMVSPLDSLELVTQLQTRGYPYEFHILEGGDHGIMNRPKERDAIIFAWFDRHLRGDER